MEKKAYSVILILGLLFTSLISGAQIPNEIIVSFKRGDSKMLSTYFNQNIELAVLGKSNICSKSQARQIMNKFFENNVPDNFRILSQEMKQEAKYVIGILNTGNGTFRIYILLKENDQINTIHLLKIEKKTDE
jgi:Ni,Fe-hydrogenase III component G